MVAKAVIIEDNQLNTVFVKSKIKGKSSIRYSDNRTVKIDSVLPFRVRFTSIKIPGYSSTNVPAIPLQVIGYSNYIL